LQDDYLKKLVHFFIAALWAVNPSWAGLTQELKPEVVAPGERADFHDPLGPSRLWKASQL
jgi:hypothetical protein